jgi:putative addiction module component (TIGR02574 family)
MYHNIDYKEAPHLNQAFIVAVMPFIPGHLRQVPPPGGALCLCTLKLDQTGDIVITVVTLDQIVEEVRHWPPEKVGELLGRLSEDLHSSAPEVEAAWEAEVSDRIAEIQAGKVTGIPGDEFSARVRKIVGR